MADASTDRPAFDYRQSLDDALHVIRVFWMMAEHIDFDEILASMSRAEAVGPILDPTLYRAAMPGMKSQRRLIEAAARFKGALAEQLAKEKGRG